LPPPGGGSSPGQVPGGGEPPALDPYLGQVIAGRYTITARIGIGGMGAVYLADQSTLQREVAIKFLHVGGPVAPELVRRFEQEARIVASLHHPNIVELYDYGLWQGVPFMVMEHVDGVTLGDRLEREGPLSLAESLSVVRQVLDALAEAHRHRVVHRDLKPANLMLVSRGLSRHLVKVLDFGIARILADEGEGGEANITRSGVILGSPKTISPEQIAGEPADPRSDLYSLGIILYFMISGQYPFVGPTPLAILYQHHHDPPPPLPVAQCPPALRRVLDRALAKQPAARYASAREMAADLEPLIGLSSGLLPPVPPRPPARRAGWRTVLLVAGLVFALALLLGGVLAAWRQRSLPEHLPAPGSPPIASTVTLPLAPARPAAVVPEGPAAAAAAPEEPRELRIRLVTEPPGLEVLPGEADVAGLALGRTPLLLRLPAETLPRRYRFRHGRVVTPPLEVAGIPGQTEVIWHADLRATFSAPDPLIGTRRAERGGGPPAPSAATAPGGRAPAGSSPEVAPAAGNPPPGAAASPGTAPGSPAPSPDPPSSPTPAAPPAVPSVDQDLPGTVPLVEEPAGERPSGFRVPMVEE